MLIDPPASDNAATPSPVLLPPPAPPTLSLEEYLRPHLAPHPQSSPDGLYLIDAQDAAEGGEGVEE
jgi:hypothetical protein